MLAFDERGNLVPYKPISSSIEEMQKYFVDSIKSEKRKINFEKYQRYSKDLKEHTGGFELRQWVDGSFVILKTNPQDINIVTFLDQKQIHKLDLHIGDYKMEGAYQLYGIDAYIVEVYEPLNSRYSYTTGDTAFWRDFFGKTRGNSSRKKFSKGFLEIIH